MAEVNEKLVVGIKENPFKTVDDNWILLKEYILQKDWNKGGENTVGMEIARATYRSVKRSLQAFKKSRGSKITEEEKQEIHEIMIREQPMTDEEIKFIKQGKRRQELAENRKKRAQEKKLREMEDDADEGDDKVNQPPTKKRRQPTKRTEKTDGLKKPETILMKKARSALLAKDYENLLCFLHLGVVPEDVADAVAEIVHKNRIADEDDDDNDSGGKCFLHPDTVHAKTYSMDCSCGNSVTFCESCLKNFTWRYVNAKDVGRRQKIGAFSCYSCNKKTSYNSDEVIGPDTHDYMEDANKFYAMIWVNILDSNKSGLLSGRDEVLERVVSWVLKTLKDDISPMTRNFLSGVLEFKTVKHEQIEICREMKSKGEDFVAYLRKERVKRLKKSKRPPQLTDTKPMEDKDNEEEVVAARAEAQDDISTPSKSNQGVKRSCHDLSDDDEEEEYTTPPAKIVKQEDVGSVHEDQTDPQFADKVIEMTSPDKPLPVPPRKLPNFDGEGSSSHTDLDSLNKKDMGENDEEVADDDDDDEDDGGMTNPLLNLVPDLSEVNFDMLL